MKTLAQSLAGIVGARNRCVTSGNADWQYNHEHKIDMLINDKLPSGSGIDNGNKLNYEKSTSKKLVIDSSYHTMDDNGGYEECVAFRVIVTASLQLGFNINIVGEFSSNKYTHGLKEYLYEIYSQALGNAV